MLVKHGPVKSAFDIPLVVYNGIFHKLELLLQGSISESPEHNERRVFWNSMLDPQSY
jgi:hypothetical protein